MKICIIGKLLLCYDSSSSFWSWFPIEPRAAWWLGGTYLYFRQLLIIITRILHS